MANTQTTTNCKPVQKPVKIAVLGLMGSGKSTLGRLLKMRYPPIRVRAFSALIRRIAIRIWGRCDRPLLQKIGRIASFTDPNLWQKCILQDLRNTGHVDCYFIDGVRYPSQFEYLRDQGAVMVYLRVLQQVRTSRLRTRDSAAPTPEVANHQCESHIGKLGPLADFTCDNDSRAALLNLVDKLLGHFGIPESSRVPWSSIDFRPGHSGDEQVSTG